MKSFRITFFLLVLFTMTYFFQGKTYGSVRVHFLDVGYGDAILVGVPQEKYIMIDVGDSVLDKLKKLKVTTLDTVVITHPHDNHFKGLNELLENIEIKNVLVALKTGNEEYAQLLKRVEDLEINLKVLENGATQISLSEDATVSVLNHPTKGLDLNNISSQAIVEHKQSMLWLTSDIGLERQDFFLSEYPQLKEADIIQGPHHGDAVSEKMKELFIFKPMVVSTGPNPYGLPDLKLLSEWQGPVYRTDEEGDITLEAIGDGWTRLEDDQ